MRSTMLFIDYFTSIQHLSSLSWVPTQYKLVRLSQNCHIQYKSGYIGFFLRFEISWRNKYNFALRIFTHLYIFHLFFVIKNMFLYYSWRLMFSIIQIQYSYQWRHYILRVLGKIVVKNTGLGVEPRSKN